jgi:endonuclease/exonuclease/phosphatase family metal-dependent hydrolase
MKRILYLTTIILLLFPAGISAGNRKKTPKPNLRILYWNIQNGMWDGQTDHYARFTDWVKEQKPDICVWCEAATIYLTGTAKGMPREDRYLPGHWDELARRYGHKYTYIGGWRDDYPQVITSKYPIEGMAQIVGEAPDSVVSHGAGWARIRVKGETLNLVTVHPWPHSFRMGVSEAEKEADIAAHGGDRYRRTEIEYVCRHTILAQPGAEKELWLMMGDFNSRSRADNAFYGYADDDAQLLVHDYIAANTPYLDALVEKHPGEFPVTMHYTARLDYLYLTPKMLEKAEDVRVCRDYYTEPVRDPQKLSNFWRPSDHRPIIADFKF